MTSNTFVNTINSNEAQTRFLQTRIDTFEKNLLDIYSSVHSYTRKMARIRDEADMLASHLLQFADTEKISKTLRSGLSHFAEHFSIIQDYRDNEIHQIEEKVINEMSLYAEITRKAKEELKNDSNARNRSLNELKDVKWRDNDRNSSSSEVSRLNMEYEQHMQTFERKKNEDIKKILLNFIEIELRFNAKTIDMLTQSFHHILSIDVESDMNEFNAHLNFNQSAKPDSPIGPNSTRRPKSLDVDNEILISPLRRFNSSPNFVSNPNKIELSKDVKKTENKNLDNNSDTE